MILPTPLVVALLFAFAVAMPARAEEAPTEEGQRDTRPPIAPDIREDETELKVQKGNFVAVPIPISNPTLGSGLVGGAAYFYPQTEEEKKRQPASLTAIGAMYTSNDSRALAIAQQNYWLDDRWRFTAVIGAADLRLSLLTSEDTSADWRVYGAFLFAQLARRLGGNWYGGMLTRAVGAEQEIAITSSAGSQQVRLDDGSDVQSVGLGAYVEYDSRDMPTNSYAGQHLKINALFNDEVLGSNGTYQNYEVGFRSYHTLADSLVLAWELRGCTRKATVPLWDACTIRLRGFSVTDYLGVATTSAQAELRWQFSRRWGVVGFAGAGDVRESFSGLKERDSVPSYGAGLRFMVLPAKRINIRVDAAWSTDSDAIHLSVGEAF